MLSWCLQSSMKIVNSIFRTKRIHRSTWRHAATNTWKRIDYICTGKWLSKFILNCRVYSEPSKDFDTDHRLLIMNMAFPRTKKELHKKLRISTQHPDAKVKSNFQALRKDKQLQDKLTVELDNALGNTNTEDTNVDELNEKITSNVRECVESVWPKINPIKKKEPWEDEELKDKIRELHRCKKTEDVRRIQKDLKKRRNQLKNAYYKELADNINSVAEAREVEKEFAMAKKYVAFKNSSKIAISNEKLKVHFTNHFAQRSPEIPIPPEVAEPEKYPHLCDKQLRINEDAPEEDEVREVLKSFKNNKSAGTDKVKTEGLKYNNSQALVKCIVVLLTLIWACVTVPAKWLHSNITCLYKNGPTNLAKNYRGLSIGANMSRIVAKIIINTSITNSMGV